MLHRCIEGERIGVDGSKIVDVDRRHDPSPGGTPAPPGESPPPSSSYLASPLDGRRVPPWSMASMVVEGREPLRDWTSLSFPFVSVSLVSSLSPFLIFPEIRNYDWAEILTRFLSRYKLPCGRRTPPTDLQGGHKGGGAPTP